MWISFLTTLVAVIFVGSALAYEFSPDWTVEMPLPYSRAIAQAFLSAHNVRRANPPRSAANMRKLVWNTSLVEQAKRVVSKCAFEQDALNGTIGQMIYAGGPDELNEAKANETLFEWYDRDIASNHVDEEGNMELKSASQILWADTSSIGCASHWCPNQIHLSNNMRGVLTACNYYPSGNFMNRPVFKIGEPCLECSEDFYYCDNKMCTREHDTFESHFGAIDPSIKQTVSPLVQNALLYN